MSLVQIENATPEPKHQLDLDLKPIENIVEVYGREADAVIQILQAVQKEYRYLPQPAMERVCELTNITPASIVGVSTFYNHFRHKPVGKHIIKVCKGTACHVKGADLVQDSINLHCGIAPGQDTDSDEKFTIQEVACIGCCSLAPVALVDSTTFGHVAATTVPNMIADFESLKDQKKVVNHREELTFGDGNGPELRIGLGSCCLAQGAEAVHAALMDEFVVSGASGRIKQVGCTGVCHQAPLAELIIPGEDPVWLTDLTPESARSLVRQYFSPKGIMRPIKNAFNSLIERLHTDEDTGDVVTRHRLDARDPAISGFLGPQKHIATEHCEILDPLDIDEYVKLEGFDALKKCVFEMEKTEIIEEIKESGLRGRGGGGFPTHFKWNVVREQDSETKYIICNGDEGDPGAFMDRVLLESVAFRVIEGMAIAGRATGSSEGIFYIRAEYPLAVSRVEAAIKLCEERGYLGENILGSGFNFKLRVKEGAGAYICGEETALIHSLEGGRGTPRVRPPFPAVSGLWEKPTLINNVETLSLVSWIIRNGASEFNKYGTETSKGTKVFALAGKVKRGGLIEVPMGVTIREVVEEIGGGCEEGRSFKAVQMGGPSGGCIPAHLGDTPIDYESLKERGAIMGSGGMVVLDDKDCMVDIARYFLRFTQDESCGKCTYCRVGTKRMLDILDRICIGKGRKGDLQTLETLSKLVVSASICGLGKTAPNPVLSTLNYFREEYEAHLKGYCPSGKCMEMIDYRINDNCIGCTLCSQHCPVDSIPMTPYKMHTIDMSTCIRCDACRVVCPTDAVFIASDPKK